ncbi:MAG TPA: type II toxin-antitoxin system RelE/ParE family toxin [Kofleriaceae bacterium]
MILSIAYAADAQRMLDEADERWIAEHGYLVDNPLIAELQHAGDLLRENPRLGRLVHQHGRARGEVRRLLLHSGWHLYYRFHGDRQLVEILAVWFANRGSSPPL